MEVILFSLIDVFSFWVQSSFSDRISFQLSAVALLLNLMFPFWAFRALKYSKIPKPFSELTANLKTRELSFYAKHYRLLFLFRRFLLAITILLIASVVLQISICIFLSISEIITILYLRPFDMSIDNYISVINETCLLAIVGILATTHYYPGESTQALVSGAFALVMAVNIINGAVLLAIICKARKKHK